MKKAGILSGWFLLLIFSLVSYPFQQEARAEGAPELRINEIYPNPDPESCPEEWCKKEWIELQNLTTVEIDLSDYQLKDAANHVFSNLSGQKIGPNAYLFFSDSNILNNSGDSVYLFKNGLVDSIDHIDYGSATKGFSFASFEESWQWTKTPTAGSANILMADNPGELANKEPVAIAAAKDKTISSAITVLGTITAQPGTLSSQFFYIEDQSGGIQIYSYYKSFPQLRKGDLVRVVGEIGESSGEKRLKITTSSDITIVSPGIVKGPSLKTELSTKDVGSFIEMEGIVEDPNGDQFYLASENSKTKVVIKNSDLVQKPALHSGFKVGVSGICSIYKGELRILPFEQGSVKILSRSDLGGKLPQAGLLFVYYLNLYMFVHLSWTIFLIMKRRHLRLQRKLLPI